MIDFFERLPTQYVVFTAMHIASFFASLLTLVLLGVHPRDDSEKQAPASSAPNRSASRSNARSLSTRSHVTPSTTRNKSSFSPHGQMHLHYLRMCACLALLMSATILVPGYLYGFQTSLLPVYWCSLQGVVLNFLFLSLHFVMFVVCIQNYLLIVCWDFARVQRLQVLWLILVAVMPFFIVSVCTGAMAIWANTDGNGSEWGRAVGVLGRAGYCFWSGNPVWIRWVAYTGWYILCTIPGTILSILVVVHLFRTRHAQKQAVQAIRQSTPLPSLLSSQFSSSTIPRANPSTQTHTYQRLFKTITKPILLRTVVFTALYTAIAFMTFIPTMIRAIQNPTGGLDDSIVANISMTQNQETPQPFSMPLSSPLSSSLSKRGWFKSDPEPAPSIPRRFAISVIIARTSTTEPASLPELTVTEFATSLVGVVMFFVFGTGRRAVLVWKTIGTGTWRAMTGCCRRDDFGY